MSVSAPSSVRELAELRDRVTRQRLELAARPEVASAGSGRADSKERSATVGPSRPFTAASPLPPLPLPSATREEELTPPAPRARASSPPAATIATLPAALRARARRLLAVIPEESAGREAQACYVALSLSRCVS